MTHIDDSAASALGAATAPRDVSTAAAADADAVADAVVTSRGVRSRRSRSGWIGPALLVLLSLVPATAGVWRLFNLASGAPVTDANARFSAAPVPVVLHVLSVIPYSLLGALQFSEPVRRRWGAWHRRAGRLLAAFGLVCAVTGVWMSVSYPVPIALQGPLLLGARVLVGLAMVVALVPTLKIVPWPGHTFPL